VISGKGKRVKIVSRFYRDETILHFKNSIENLDDFQWSCEIPQVWESNVQKMTDKYADEALLRKGSVWTKAKKIESELDFVAESRIIDYAKIYVPFDFSFSEYKTSIIEKKMYVLGWNPDGRKKQIGFPLETGLPVMQVTVYHG
jgi:hypothetical protein